MKMIRVLAAAGLLAAGVGVTTAADAQYYGDPGYYGGYYGHGWYGHPHHYRDGYYRSGWDRGYGYGYGHPRWDYGGYGYHGGWHRYGGWRRYDGYRGW